MNHAGIQRAGTFELGIGGHLFVGGLKQVSSKIHSKQYLTQDSSYK